MKRDEKSRPKNLSSFLLFVRIFLLIALGLLALLAINYIEIIISNENIKFGIIIGIGMLLYALSKITFIVTSSEINKH